jgi:hypothetical protein
MKFPKLLAVAFALILSAHAQDEVKPLHLVISKVGNKMALYNKGKELKFTMMAEIQDCLNFSLNGEFTKAKIEKATVVAPDGKTYELAALGEQPPASEGNLLQFLWIQFGDAHTGFSIGSWKVQIKFQVDGASYEHEADYLVTWRKPGDGIWGGSLWANESEKKAESGPRE